MKYFTALIPLLLLVACSRNPNLEEDSAISPSFTSEIESFSSYRYPDWFRDAKFGIWSHWGPQSVPRQGDWYARKMYLSDVIDDKTNEPTGKSSPEYKYHTENYGHPTRFGYKDLLPLWKAEKWNPEQLMALYRRAGARYFVSMAVHHDNFFLWDSKIHRWNSVHIGPMMDILGRWQEAAKKEGMRFGISEHLAASFNWFQPSHMADKSGPLQGVPYDGANPSYQDLYHKPAAPDDNGWLTKDTANHRIWLNSIIEVIDMYQPDIVYSDSELPFGETGRKMLAHFYNQNIIQNAGRLEAVYICKKVPSEGRWVQTIEREVLDSISSYPWQTDTSIGDWYYRNDQQYLTGTEIIQLLVDVVSKNGNLLLNVAQTPEGDLDINATKILEEIARWTPANGEGIFGTRPWKIYGEGPSTTKKDPASIDHVKDIRSYMPEDKRFTTKDHTLFVFCMARPQTDIRITSLAKSSPFMNQKIKSVTLMGSQEKLKWEHENDALIVKLPDKLPDWDVIGFRITLKDLPEN